MTDNETKLETIVNETGTYVVNENGVMDLVKPSQKFFDDRPLVEDEVPEPTELEILQDDVAFLAETVASSMDDTEMIAEEVAYSIDDSVILAETLASVIDELELVKSELATLKEGGV